MSRIPQQSKEPRARAVNTTALPPVGTYTLTTWGPDDEVPET